MKHGQIITNNPHAKSKIVHNARVLATVLVVALLFLSGCGTPGMPTADPGQAQAVMLGDSVTLSGLDSSNSRSDTLYYHWSITAAPTGSLAVLAGPSTAEPLFTPDMVGKYTITLVVDNGWLDSPPTTVTIDCTLLVADPVLFGSDPTGQIQLFDLTPIENSRTATNVNFSLRYTLKNNDSTRANIGISVYGLDADNNEIFRRDLSDAIDPGNTKITSYSFGELLTITEFESIVTWGVDSITIYP